MNSIKKYKLRLLMTTLLFINFFNVIAQEIPENHTYSIITSETCKMKTDGGCWIVVYLVLSFENDSVLVYNRTKGNCHPTSTIYDNEFVNAKTYSWYEINGVIHINGFDNFGTFIILEDKLIGNKNNGKVQYVEFIPDVS
jgi:hypothetical protein